MEAQGGGSEKVDRCTIPHHRVREQFSLAVVYLVTSKLCIVLLSNFAFVLVVLLASACKSL